MTALASRAYIDDPTNNANAEIGLLAMYDALSEATEKPELDIASASTCNIGAMTSAKLRITGTTTITSFGTVYRGPILIRMAAALTITHNATTLVCPGNVSMVTAAGDVLMAWPKATTSGTSNGWQLVVLGRGDGGATFYAYAAANQSVTSGAWTKVTLGTESFDSAGAFASSTFTAPVDGYYSVSGLVRGYSATLTSVTSALYKNGAILQRGANPQFSAATNASLQSPIFIPVKLLAGDALELWGNVVGGAPEFNYTSANATSYFGVTFARHL